ncbi:MAG: BACON domain-containing protein, partial [Blastocatellia bacterium]
NNAVVYHRPVHIVQPGEEAVRQGGKVGGKGTVNPDASIQGRTFMGPADLAKDYNYQPIQTAGFQGQGQKIGIIIDSDVSDSDMAAFRSQFGLPAANLQRLVLPNLSNPGMTADGQLEANLDTQSISGVAPLAEIDLITIPRLDSVSISVAEEGVINLGSIRIVNESFGGCEQDDFNTTDQNLFAQAASQGIAFFAAAGDTGAECVNAPGSPAIQCPACYSTVTSVGGTQIQALFDTSGNFQSKTSETVWNAPPGIGVDCSGRSAGGGASGGGVSKLVAIPSYQQGAQGFTGGVPSGTTRFVPDVAALAGTPFTAVFQGGAPLLVGGTSLSSPLWAGMMALINEFQGAPQGSPNSVLYQAGITQYKNGGAQAFQDITSGNNSTAGRGSCDPTGVTGFSAGTGYDPVTGWGIPNFAVLIQSFGPGSGTGCGFSLSPTSRSIPSSGGTGSISVTAGLSCGWTATTTESWITVTSGGNGVGAGTVNYSVTQNLDLSQRTGAIQIGSAAFTITQAANSSGGGQLVELAVDGGSYKAAIGETSGGTEY